MQAHIEWTEPPAVLEYEKAAFKKLIWKYWWFTTKWCWPLWFVALVILYYLGPPVDSPAKSQSFFATFILVGFLLPSGLILLPSLQSLPRLASKEVRHELNSKGICIRGDGVMSWKRLESYRFDDHPDLPRLRILEVKGKPIKGLIVLPVQLSFDPSQTSEQEMRALLEQFSR